MRLRRRVVVEDAAAPRPDVAGRAEAGTFGIREDVRAGAAETLVVIDHTAAEAFLEEVPDATVAPVEALCVEAVKPVHPCRQELAKTLDDEVEVIVE